MKQEGANVLKNKGGDLALGYGPGYTPPPPGKFWFLDSDIAFGAFLGKSYFQHVCRSSKGTQLPSVTKFRLQ